MSARALSEMAYEACKLAALLEGIEVLVDASKGPEEDQIAKYARNSLPPMMEILIARAWALNDDLERAELEEKRRIFGADRQ